MCLCVSCVRVFCLCFCVCFCVCLCVSCVLCVCAFCLCFCVNVFWVDVLFSVDLITPLLRDPIKPFASPKNLVLCIPKKTPKKVAHSLAILCVAPPTACHCVRMFTTCLSRTWILPNFLPNLQSDPSRQWHGRTRPSFRWDFPNQNYHPRRIARIASRRIP